MKTKAVLFDLDGTLLNTLEDITDGCNEALKQFGYTTKSVEEIRLAVGNGFRRLVEQIVPQGKENPIFEQVYEAAHSAYAKCSRNKTKPYEGILQAMQNLKQKNILMGIISNKPDEQVKELSTIFFSDFVKPEASVGEKESEGIRRKPYPDSVFSVMKFLGTSKEETVYVGDSDVDITTAKNAGLKCISVTWGFRPRNFLLEHGATSLIDFPLDLIKALD